MASLPAPAAKKAKKACHFDKLWIKEFKGITRVSLINKIALDRTEKQLLTLVTAYDADSLHVR